jgi:hypothetical protein
MQYITTSRCRVPFHRYDGDLTSTSNTPACVCVSFCMCVGVCE